MKHNQLIIVGFYLFRLLPILLYLWLGEFSWAQLSASCATATAGGTAQCTASGGTGPYTYSVSAGSGSIGASDGVYTAPATVEVKQKVGPCQLLPPDHIYNTRIDALPVHADSATIIGRTAATTIKFEPSWGSNIMDNSTPTFDAVFTYTPLNNGAYQILPWPFLKREAGVFSGAFSGVDRHVVAVNRETCEFSDIYNNYNVGDNPTQCPLCTAQSGVKYFSDHILPTTGATDAAGMAQQPVSLKLSDIQSGAISHALRFAMANSVIQAGASTNYQWPATTGNPTPSCTAPCWKYGMYARLKSSFDISGYSAAAQVILTALKQYGMVMTDGTSSSQNYSIQVNIDVILDYATRAAIREIFYSAIRSTDFEVPDTSSMDLAAANAAVNLANGYVTPSQYAEVTVTDAAMATATTRVNLRGITVGVPEPTMMIMAGHTVTPIWWVTGTATQTVTWTMDPDVGTINSSTGEFTPDSGVTTPTRTRLTATSTVDATATAVIDVVVWPDNESGNIYQDWGIGDTTSYTYLGHEYHADDYVHFEGWTSIVDGNQAGDIFANQRLFSNDLTAKWYLPNGNYRLRVYYKVPGSGAIPADQYKNHYETQGALVYRNFTAGRGTDINATKDAKGYIDLPLKVTDGSGYLAIRHLTGTENPASIGIVAGIAIEADSTTPFIAIDNGGVTSDITISKTRQFYAVGWYMSDSVTWSVQSGPGSIDANGLYTAPSTPPATPQTVTVRATSTVDAMIYAETTFNFAFGTVVVSGPSSVSRGQTAQFTANIGGVAYTNVLWIRSGSQGSIGPTGLYSAPGSIVDGSITITATPLDPGGSDGTANLNLQQLIDPIRVYASNLADLTDQAGRVWKKQPGPCTVVGSPTTYADGQTIANLPDPLQEPIYEWRMYRTSAGTIGYDCPVPNGRFDVIFKWANANALDFKTKQDIQLEGVTVATDFEITVEAGGVLIALDRTFSTVVTDGVLSIRLVGKANAPNQLAWAWMQGIQILDLGPVSTGTAGGLQGAGTVIRIGYP